MSCSSGFTLHIMLSDNLAIEAANENAFFKFKLHNKTKYVTET